MLAALGARTFTQAFAAQNEPEDLETYVAEAFSEARIAAELGEAGSTFLIGFDPETGPERPVGYCRLVGGATKEAIRGPAPVELQRLYVEAGRRNGGYGSALLWEGLSLARRLGYRTLWLGVWERNHGAVRFYERWGFEAVGSHDFVLGSDRQTDLLMVRPL